MCYSPVRVKNNKHGFNPYYDRAFNLVPCNHCGECQTNRKNSYLIRAAVSSKFIKYKDTFVPTKQMMFFCLTYDKNKLPMCTLPDGKRISCFNRDDITKFFNKIETKLWRLGVHFKKFAVCEYGHGEPYIDRHGMHRVGTKRPHIHVILFLDHELNPFWFMEFINKNWNFGLVRYGEEPDPVVKSTTHAIKYVVKYITKFDSTSQKFDEFLHSVNENKLLYDLENCMKNGWYFGDVLEQLSYIDSIKKRKPFIVTSMHFGEGIELCQEFIKLDIKNNCVYFSDPDLQDVKKYKLPTYYHRKYNYEYDVKELTDFNKRFYLHRSGDFGIKYTPKVEVKSYPRDTYLDNLEKSLCQRFIETQDVLQSQVCMLLSVYPSEDLQFLDKYKDIISLFNNINYNKLTYYVLFNRNYVTCYYGDNSSAFLNRVCGDPLVFDCPIDDDLFHEDVLRVLYEFNRFCGVKRDAEFRKNYELKNISRSYRYNFY